MKLITAIKTWWKRVRCKHVSVYVDHIAWDGELFSHCSICGKRFRVPLK